MEYRLICNGSLLPEADLAKAMPGLRKITRMSDEDIHAKLLSGQRAKLKSGTDQARMQAIYDYFRALGVDVSLEQVARRSIGDRVMTAVRASSRGLRIATLLLLLLAGGAAYLWYWFHAPLPPAAQQAEAALADGQLNTLGHIDVQKLLTLQRYMLGDLDPEALPVEGDERDLLDHLLDGQARLRTNLHHVFFALHAGGKQRGSITWLMTGEFDRGAIMDALAQTYRIEQGNDPAWSTLHARPQLDPMACPTDKAQFDAAPLYLQVLPQWLLLTSDPQRGERVITRLRDAYPTTQDLTDWHAYRNGNLATLMLLSPAETGAAIGGIAGMLGSQAAGKATTVSNVAASLGADVLARGMHINLRLQSADAAWNRATVTQLRDGLEVLRNDSRKVSPTLAGLLAGIVLSNEPNGIAANISLDAGVVDDLGEVMQEGFASLLSVNVRDVTPGEGTSEQLDSNPIDYADSAGLTDLPALQLESYESKPLFQQGAFSVDLDSIKPQSDGVLELQLQGRVALPPSNGGLDRERQADLLLRVDRVADAAGNNLLRDERCIKPGEVISGVRNHEPATSGQLFSNRGQITKHLRLAEGVKPEDVEHISGVIELSAPVAVRKFTPAMRAGESIEHAGVRFYLSSMSSHSVSYQVSGNRRGLLEVRGLNSKGQVLRKGWRMSGDENTQVTQDFEGDLAALEIYIAERVVKHVQPFELMDLFGVPVDEGKPMPDRFAPAAIDPLDWDAYAALKLDALVPDASRHYLSAGNKPAVGKAGWPGVKLFITHTPESWGNAPQAHVFFPMLPALPGVLSAFSYRIEVPVAEGGVVDRFAAVSYPYRSNTGEWVADSVIDGRPMAMQTLSLVTGLAERARLDHLKGSLTFRLPLETSSTTLPLNSLWEGVTIDGIRLTLTGVSRGMFPGYKLELSGALDRLVNLHGLSASGGRVMADPVNYQDGGYWTMTVPFGKGIEQVELVTATRQKVHEYPFDLKAVYP